MAGPLRPGHYPLGELHHGRFFLGIHERSMLYLVVDWLAVFGTGDAGLIALCQATKATPVAEPAG